MQTVLIIVQSVLAVLLSLSILLQQRGSGLSAAFGGTGGFYSTRRGAEKVLMIATVILAVLFILNALAFMIV